MGTKLKLRRADKAKIKFAPKVKTKESSKLYIVFEINDIIRNLKMNLSFC